MMKFENPIKKFFTKKDDSVLGVDIGPSSIKVVQLKRKHGKAILETYGALALGPYAGIEIGKATALPPEKLSEALIDLMREANVTSRNCGVSIPMSSSLVTNIEVPHVEAKQMAQIIPIEARKYIPVPITEVLLDWWEIPREESSPNEFEMDEKEEKKKSEKSEVLLVVIHNDALARMQEVIKLSELEATFYEIEIFSTIRSVMDREGTPIMIFDLGASSTKLYIVDKGILRTSHIINRGSQDLTMAISKSMSISTEEAENLKRSTGFTPVAEGTDIISVVSSTLSFIFSEAERVLLNYQKKYLKNIGKIVLTGGGVGLKGFKEIAQETFGVNVVFADPFAKVESPAFLEGVLKQVGPEFAVSVGLALRKLQENDK